MENVINFGHKNWQKLAKIDTMNLIINLKKQQRRENKIQVFKEWTHLILMMLIMNA